MSQNEENLRNFLINHGKEFNIEYINDHVLSLPTKKLHRFIKNVKYRSTLGEFKASVFEYFENRGYDNEVIY